MRRLAIHRLAFALALFVLTTAAAAEDEWAILGHELGCWRLSSIREQLAADRNHPELADLAPFATPSELVAQLRRHGMNARAEEGQFGGHRVVMVLVDQKLRVRFISRRYCRDAPYDLR